MTADKPMPLVPTLRFPEFEKAGDWDLQALSSLAEPISEKVGTTECVPMSVTTGVGLVSQEDKFGRIIAGDSYKNYIKLQTNDFAYNKSATKEFPQGYIARYSGVGAAGVPNSIFTCFRPDTAAVLPEYLDHLFQSNYHGRWLRNYITVGARAHGALSVSDDDLFAMPVPLPPAKASRGEQKKIADCLDSLDDLIAAEARKLEALRQHKLGLMRQLFPEPGETLPRLRFPRFLGSAEWNLEPVSKLAQVATGNRNTQDQKDVGRYPFFVRSQSVARIDTYAHDGEAVLTSGDGVGVGSNFHYINGKFDFHQRVYCIYNFRSDVSARFFYYYFSQHFGPHVRRLSAKNSVDSVRRAMITDMEISLPGDREQEAVARCLSTLDVQVAAQRQKLDVLIGHKKGLLQQLFPSLEEEAR